MNKPGRQSETNRKESRPCSLAHCDRRASDCIFFFSCSQLHSVCPRAAAGTQNACMQQKQISKQNPSSSQLAWQSGCEGAGVKGHSFTLKFTPNASNAIMNKRESQME